jgi:uncharacterized protein (TIGR02246 family)
MQMLAAGAGGQEDDRRARGAQSRRSSEAVAGAAGERDTGRMLRYLFGVLMPVLAACHAVRALPEQRDPEGELARVLDALHGAAARADGAAYFELFAPDAVFLGTDASERWSVAEFRAYAEPFFSQGVGWTYEPRERHVFLDPTRRVAWFDERLWNAKYGEVRGSGVLMLGDGRWRIAQYNLAIPVPNALAADLVARIRALAAGPGN